MPQPIPLLTIAGSDSGGAAGLQADLKTWAVLGANTAQGLYGMCAVTAVTAQNSERVAAIHYLPPQMIAAQIDAVLSDYGAAAIKTGFLGRADIVEVVAERLAYWRNMDLSGFPKPDRSRSFIVIDPVLVNHRGEAMFGPEVTAAYRRWLFPLADLVTPNMAEARLLGVMGGAPGSGGPGEMENTSETARLLVKGAMRTGGEIVDVFQDGARLELPQPFIDTLNTHGSGDALSAAICAYLALGHDWPDAIRRAQAYTLAAIRRGAAWRLGAGHGPVGHGLPDGDPA